MPKNIGVIKLFKGYLESQPQRSKIHVFSKQQGLLEIEYIEIDYLVADKKKAYENLSKILKKGGCVVAIDLSCMGKNLPEALKNVKNLALQGVSVLFVKQPELSIHGASGKKVLTVLQGVIETEKQLNRLRVNHTTTLAKEKGMKLGRPMGSRNKKGVRLARFKNQIEKHLKTGLSMMDIHRIISKKIESPISYMTLKNYVNDTERLKVLR